MRFPKDPQLQEVRKVYKDIRELVTIDLDTASDIDVRVLANQIWGVSPRDPVALGSVAAGMLLAALVACYVPARRAMKVDPIIALRQE